MEMQISHIMEETPKVKSFILNSSMDFIPGQTIKCSIPGSQESKTFSIATSPTEGAVAFTTLMGSSSLKNYLSSAKPGDVVNVEGPFGSNFTINDSIAKPIMMIAGGIGVTPFRSMIKWSIDTEFPISIKLLHSIKTEEDMIYKDDIESWEDSDKFWYVPVLTQQSPTDWYGELERIDRKMIERHMEEDSIFYVAGKPDFVDHILSLLNEMGIGSERIHIEKFHGY